MRAVPRLCEFYPGFTTVEKARKNLSQGEKNLSQGTVYILPKHPHIEKPTHTHTRARASTHYKTHTHPHITKQYKTTTLQIKTNTV